jgi:uncharacterized LabA/DUF88 family protein
MQKIAIFVDVQNIYYTVRQTYHCQFDYRAFWALATMNREVVAATAYAIDRSDKKQQGFQQALRNIGFEIKLKPFIQRSDGSAKGDWDVGITLDVIDYAKQVDIIILLSGDGDFDLLLHKVRRDYLISTEVYGVQRLTAASLINAADRFVPIKEKLLLNYPTPQ